MAMPARRGKRRGLRLCKCGSAGGHSLICDEYASRNFAPCDAERLCLEWIACQLIVESSENGGSAQTLQDAAARIKTGQEDRAAIAAQAAEIFRMKGRASALFFSGLEAGLVLVFSGSEAGLVSFKKTPKRARLSVFQICKF